MKVFWNCLGRIAFWVSIPLLHVYLKRAVRTRVLLVADNRVLVVKGWLNDGKWSLPGGGLHRHEDAKVGVQRELKEETGVVIDADDLTHVGKTRQSQHGLDFAYHQFVGTIGTMPKLRPQRWEIIEARWLAVDALNKDNAQTHVLDTIAAWRAHR